MDSVGHLLKWSEFGGIASMFVACIFMVWLGSKIFLSKNGFDQKCKDNRESCQTHTCRELQKISSSFAEMEKKRDRAREENQVFREAVIAHMSKTSEQVDHVFSDLSKTNTLIEVLFDKIEKLRD